jgi:hypothetical protein
MERCESVTPVLQKRYGIGAVYLVDMSQQSVPEQMLAAQANLTNNGGGSASSLFCTRDSTAGKNRKMSTFIRMQDLSGHLNVLSDTPSRIFDTIGKTPCRAELFPGVRVSPSAYQ